MGRDAELVSSNPTQDKLFGKRVDRWMNAEWQQIATSTVYYREDSLMHYWASIVQWVAGPTDNPDVYQTIDMTVFAERIYRKSISNIRVMTTRSWKYSHKILQNEKF